MIQLLALIFAFAFSFSLLPVAGATPVDTPDIYSLTLDGSQVLSLLQNQIHNDRIVGNGVERCKVYLLKSADGKLGQLTFVDVKTNIPNGKKFWFASGTQYLYKYTRDPFSNEDGVDYLTHTYQPLGTDKSHEVTIKEWGDSYFEISVMIDGAEQASVCNVDF